MNIFDLFKRFKKKEPQIRVEEWFDKTDVNKDIEMELEPALCPLCITLPKEGTTIWTQARTTRTHLAPPTEPTPCEIPRRGRGRPRKH